MLLANDRLHLIHLTAGMHAANSCDYMHPGSSDFFRLAIKPPSPICMRGTTQRQLYDLSHCQGQFGNTEVALLCQVKSTTQTIVVGPIIFMLRLDLAYIPVSAKAQGEATRLPD